MSYSSSFQLFQQFQFNVIAYLYFVQKIEFFQSRSMKQLNLTQNSKFKPMNDLTIAQLNKVSIKQSRAEYNPHSPFRILLPQYFNIPSFKDKSLPFSSSEENKTISIMTKQDAQFKKRMKDLTLLSQGMKRAKNIKQQSRYYFTQGVLLHNAEQYLKSVQYFQKFLKIVIYLQDNKSTELALNVIGCSYMYLGEYQKGIEFHDKQGKNSNRSDQFMSSVNKGICNELIGNVKEAYSLYQEAQMILQRDQNDDKSQLKREALTNMIQRVQQKLRQQQVFMTSNNRGHSPGKSIQSSILKEESSLLLKKASSRKQYEKNKLKYAIYAAQQNIQQQIKSSVKYQNSQ